MSDGQVVKPTVELPSFGVVPRVNNNTRILSWIGIAVAAILITAVIVMYSMHVYETGEWIYNPFKSTDNYGSVLALQGRVEEPLPKETAVSMPTRIEPMSLEQLTINNAFTDTGIGSGAANQIMNENFAKSYAERQEGLARVDDTAMRSTDQGSMFLAKPKFDKNTELGNCGIAAGLIKTNIINPSVGGFSINDWGNPAF